MAYLKDSKFAIAVSEAGLHMVVDDILTPKEAIQLLADIKNALHEWATITCKFTDSGKSRKEI